MTRPSISLTLSAITLSMLAGCAKYPKSGSGYGYTLLSFHYTMGAAVSSDQNYIYSIAIRPLTESQYVSASADSLGPGPAIEVGTKNGVVTGRPTRFIVWSPSSSQSGYLNYRFVNPPTDDTDPDPGTQSNPSEVISGSDPTISGAPDSLGFVIRSEDLVDNSDDASSIVATQFNILATSKAAHNSGDLNGRAIDALGDQRSTTTITNPRTVLITTSGRYDNSGKDGGQASSIPEPANDVYGAPSNQDPQVDIVDWYLDVKTP